MAELLETKVCTASQITSMLKSKHSDVRVSALGHLLNGDQPIDDFVTLIEELLNSKMPSIFHMTEGNVAALILAVKASRPYDGDNDIVKHQIGIAK